MLNFLKVPVYSWVLMLGVVAAMLAGNLFTAPNLDWYDTIVKPDLNPPEWVFGPMWTFLYVLLIFAAWRLGKFAGERGIRFWFIVWLFVLNLVLNAVWSYLFFAEHLLGAALIDAGGLLLSAVLIAFLAWPIDRRVTLVFAIYSAWLAFATFLSYQIWSLN